MRSGEQRDAQDHGTDVLGDRRLEEIRSASGTVPNVVANQVGHHTGVARIVLGNAGFYLADEIGADVGRLGVDAAAELCEERHEAGTESHADDKERRVLRRGETAVEEKHAVHAEKRQRHHEKPAHGASAQGHAKGRTHTGTRSVRGTDVRFDRDVHADDAAEGARCRTDQEGHAGANPQLPADDRRLREVLEDRNQHRDEDRRDDSQATNRRVLPFDESDRSFVDRLAHRLHFRGAGVGPQNVPSQVGDEAEGQHA